MQSKTLIKYRKCELCGFEFNFKNIYEENAPKNLNILQVIYGSILLILNSLYSLSRIILVAFSWGLFIPYSISQVFKGCIYLEYDYYFGLKRDFFSNIP
jgi:E3 ubiquitin-protein ligase DOA10